MQANIRTVVALAAVAVVGAAGAGAQPMPPPVDPSQLGANKMNLVRPGTEPGEAAWADLLRDEPFASRAVLDLAGAPKTTVHLLQKKLKPLKADKAVVKKWIGDLGSEKDDVRKSAFAQLSHFDPRLVFDPAEAFAEARTPVAKQLLLAILADSVDPERFPTIGGISFIEMRKTVKDGRAGTFAYALVVSDGGRRELRTLQTFAVPEGVQLIQRPTWTRTARAVVVLEHIGAPEALALLKELATGHPDALPTRTAKQAVARLTAPAP